MYPAGTQYHINISLNFGGLLGIVIGSIINSPGPGTQVKYTASAMNGNTACVLLDGPLFDIYSWQRQATLLPLSLSYLSITSSPLCIIRGLRQALVIQYAFQPNYYHCAACSGNPSKCRPTFWMLATCSGAPRPVRNTK